MLLRNAAIVDGSGREPYLGSVRFVADRITEVGDLAAHDGEDQRDCAGLVAAPGFLDLHSHSDLQALDPRRDEKSKQGVTAELVGNCGFSPFPLGAHADLLREFARGIFHESGDWGWNAAGDYLSAAYSSAGRTDIYALAGHGSLRVSVAGLRQAITRDEARQMNDLLGAALDQGCSGLSTGLMYAPGSAAGREELEPLCRTVAAHDRLYATHMRSYSAGLLEATREQLDLARATGCRLQISHLQAAGRANWDLQRRALDEIERAAREGVDVEFDIYPYQCGSTVLTQWAPDWAMDGGADALCRRIADSADRLRMARDIESSKRQSWEDVTITGVHSQANAEAVGRTIAQIAAARNAEPVDVMLDLLLAERARVNIITFNQSESNLRELLSHPLCSVITDGFYVNGLPHPRLHGTYPELLGRIVREKRWLPLAEAVHKITEKPARRLGLAGCGLAQPGYRADLVLFDPERIASPATYAAPEQDPAGVVAVFRGGQPVAGRAAA